MDDDIPDFLENMPPPPSKPSDTWDLSGGNVFSFLEAVRSHKDPKSIENLREDMATNCNIRYSCADALRFSIMYSHITYAEHLLENNVTEALSDSICCPLLLLAVRLNTPECVEALCNYSRTNKPHNQYIDIRGCSTMECRRSALHTAAETGNIECIKTLLKYGADVTVTDDSGCTPLARILFKLQKVHLNEKVIRCAFELLKCETKLQFSYGKALNYILAETSHNVLTDRVPGVGPFSLLHLSRCSVRKQIGYPRLPEAINELGLPKTLHNYLRLGYQ